MRIYATYHPSAVIEGGFQFEQRILEDLCRFSRPRLKPPVEALPRSKSIGFDTEYAPDGSLLTVGVADSARSLALEVTEKDWLKRLKPIVKKANVLVGHSVDGDLDHLVKLKLARNDWLAGKNILDSFLLARMSDENRGKGGYGLQPLLLSEFNFSDWKAETEKLLKKNPDARLWTPEQRTARCRMDAWATKVLADHYTADGVSPLVTYTHRIAMALHRVGLAGAAINLKTFHKLGKGWRDEAARLRDSITRFAHRKGMGEFVPTNDEHLRELLYERLELPVYSYTRKDHKAQVDKGTLKRLLKEEGDNKFIDDLLKFNQVDKLASTWYGREGDVKGNRKPSVGDLIQPIPGDRKLGLLHFWIFPLRARTGRRASGGGEEGDPQSRNSQNWPNAARGAVVSRWKNRKIAICDFTRLEVVLVGWRANDEKLLDFFLNGNGYIGVAKEFWGQDVKNDTPLYKATKCIVLGLNYNMGFYKLAMDLWYRNDFRFSDDWKTHVRKTKEARKRYLKMFKGLRRYIRERIQEVTETQQVVSPTGRIRHMPHHGPESEGFWHIENACVNFPIQSFASDVTGSAVIDYEAALLKEHKLSYTDWHSALLEHPWDLPCSPVFNEVHDELDLDLNPKTGKADLELLIDCMQNVRSVKKLVPGFDLKLKVDTQVVEHWKQ